MPIRPLLLLTFVLAACGGDRGDAPAADAQSKQSRAAPAADSQAPVQREGILFAIRPYDESGSGLDPIALVTRGGLRNVWDVESDSAFAARYYAPGTRYALRVGGAAAGEASVLGMVEPQCQERFARADVRPTRTLPVGWEGLRVQCVRQRRREADRAGAYGGGAERARRAGRQPRVAPHPQRRARRGRGLSACSR